MAPCAQFSPRSKLSVAVPLFQDALQAWMAVFATVGVDSASASCNDDSAVTFFRPRGFWKFAIVWVLTAPAARAIVFDVPSVTEAMVYACCQAKSPVVGQLNTGVVAMKFGAFFMFPKLIVVPTHAR